MAVNRVEIKNLTVFEDTAVDFCKGINVLIGENGTGKTHLMKFIASILNSQSLDKLLSPHFSLLFDDYLSALLRVKNIEGTCDINYAVNFKSGFRISPSEKENEYANISHRIREIVKYNHVFIPAKDMLTHSRGFPSLVRQKMNMPFDETLMEIIDKALVPIDNIIPEIALGIIPVLAETMGGKIIIDDYDFYILRNDGRKIKFSAEAEGNKKLGLLWQLLMNGSITKDTILFWDEPEANINPKLVPVIVEILLELSRQGVQIFAATHDYVFSKYFEVRRKKGDLVMFHSLYEEKVHGVKCESNINFRDLKNNSIISANSELMNEVINFDNLEV